MTRVSTSDYKPFVNRKDIQFCLLRTAPILSSIRLKTYSGRLFVKGTLFYICIVLFPHLGESPETWQRSELCTWVHTHAGLLDSLTSHSIIVHAGVQICIPGLGASAPTVAVHSAHGISAHLCCQSTC